MNKKDIERLAIRLLRNDLAWKAGSFFVRSAGFMKRMRQIGQLAPTTNVALRGEHLFDKLEEPVVRRGPFAGLRYPSFGACGSQLCPKILGCYEAELHDVIDRTLREDYETVVDVGCAEGYYANGYAMKKPGLRVIAHDIEEKARADCRAMAEANDVADRVEVRGACGPEELKQWSGKRTLVISDCEGYELDLFMPEAVAALADSDVLIETHDLNGREILEPLRARFAKTHRMEVVHSIDDLAKARSYDYPETRGLPFGDRLEMFAEGRRMQMEWLVCWSKSQATGTGTGDTVETA